MSQQSPMRTSRSGRFAMLGGLATGIAGRVISDGAKQLMQGRKPLFSELLMSQGNARQISETLSKMRGAAMKVGQLLSMDVGYLLPPEIASLFSNLRQNAHFMSMMEVAGVLEKELGENWQKHFHRFEFTPIAAASIGQVHRAELPDGRVVAIKIQYPGVADSIDSDIQNVQMVLKMLGLVPREVNLDDLMEDARQQLHDEADYRKEAAAIAWFGEHLQHDDRFALPEVCADLSTERVLTMSFLPGESLENLQHASLPVRQAVAADLLELSLREVFDWGLVQTDPNFGNYFYDTQKQQIQLLDFGASRLYDEVRQQQLRALMSACIAGDEDAIQAAAIEVGYLSATDKEAYQKAIVSLLKTATLPLREQGLFDFRNNVLGDLMAEQLIELRVRQKFARVPPTDVLFLHRKLGGLYLVLTRLGVRLDVGQVVRAVTGCV